MTRGKSKGLFFNKPESYQPHEDHPAVQRNAILVSFDGYNLIADLCADLAETEKEKEATA